jgi:WD40 repeat protein
LSPALTQFVKQSKEKLYSQQRALKRLTRIVAIIFIGLIGLGIRYYFKQKNTQEIRENTVFALLQEKADPLTSINTAFKIREEDTLSSLVQGIIIRSFHSLLNGKISAGDSSVPKEFLPVSIPVKDSICSFRMNRSGTYFYGWTSRNEIILLDLKDSRVTTFSVPDPVLIIELSDDAKYFAVVYENSTGEVFTSSGEKIFDFQTSPNHLMNNRLVRFFPRGKYFLAAVKDNTAEIYDSTGTVIYRLEGHTGSVNSLDISPDGRFVVTASSDKNALIWNYNNRIFKFTPYDTIEGHLDTVWSCEFNKTGKYIITASGDSMLRISDLNGYQRERFLTFTTNTSGSRLSTLFLPSESSNDTKQKYLWADTSLNLDAHNKKICDARFASNDRAIISSNYCYDMPGCEKTQGIFRTEVVYFGQSYNNYSLYDYYLTKARNKYSDWSQQYINCWEISPDRQFYAAVPRLGNDIIVSMSNGYQMLSLKGSNPMFSFDGKYLYYINDRKLNRLIVSLDEIYSFVFEKRLFGDPETGKHVWLLL